MRCALLLFVVVGGCEQGTKAPAPPGVAAKLRAPRPNAAAKCSMALTQPSAYQRDFAAGDYCVVDTSGTILFEPHVGVGTPDDRAERSLAVHVEAGVAAGTTVTLTTKGQGQLTDPIRVQYSGGTVETRCLNTSGTATLLSPRPALDVTFDLTCMLPGYADGLRMVGEFRSTL